MQAYSGKWLHRIRDAQSTEKYIFYGFVSLVSVYGEFFFYGRIYRFYLTRFGYYPPSPDPIVLWNFFRLLPPPPDFSEFRLGNPAASVPHALFHHANGTAAAHGCSRSVALPYNHVIMSHSGPWSFPPMPHVKFDVSSILHKL